MRKKRHIAYMGQWGLAERQAGGVVARGRWPAARLHPLDAPAPRRARVRRAVRPTRRRVPACPRTELLAIGEA